MGDSVPWDARHEMDISVEGLLAGDVVKVITATSGDILLQAPADGNFQTTYTMPQPGFARVEVYRSFLAGLPLLPALITNPIYFER
jgi:hypothetical protein